MRKILVPLALFTAAAQVHAQDAAALVSRDCMSCHGTEVYTREGRMVRSLEGLRQQIARCHSVTGKKWSATDVENVVQYLNATYYKF